MTALVIFCACAEVQRIPGEVRYGAPVVERSEFSQQPIAEQRVTVALRSTAVTAPAPQTTAAAKAPAPVTTAASAIKTAAPITTAASAAGVRILEARLAEAPLCTEAAVERMDGTRIVEGKLDRQDQVIMWSGYGGAGLAALLTAIGMIRGKGAARGMGIFAVYGIPLAGVGAYETYRMWPREEPIEPKLAKVNRRGVPCPAGKDALPVELVGADSTAAMTLNQDWKALAIVPRQTDFKGETRVPTVFRAGKLTAFLSNAKPYVEAVSALPRVPMPASVAVPVNAPAPVSAPAAVLVHAPAPVTAAVALVRGCAAVAVQTDSSGWLPKEFFEQPQTAFKLEDGVSLNKVADDKLGGRAFAWQIFELNPGLAKLLDGPRPLEIKLPAQARPAAFWKAKLPPMCE